MPPLSLRELFQSLWDWDSSRSDKHCLRSKREGLIRRMVNNAKPAIDGTRHGCAAVGQAPPYAC